MLTNEDVENLFFDLGSAYQNLFKLGDRHVPVWRKYLRRYSAAELQVALERAIDVHLKPPTLPEFLQLLRIEAEQKAAMTRSSSPQSSDVPINSSNANVGLLRVLMAKGAVSDQRIDQLVELKNAMRDDLPPGLEPGAQGWQDFESELSESADIRDPDRGRDGELARERFCRRAGIRYEPQQINTAN